MRIMAECLFFASGVLICPTPGAHSTAPSQVAKTEPTIAASAKNPPKLDRRYAISTGSWSDKTISLFNTWGGLDTNPGRRMSFYSPDHRKLIEVVGADVTLRIDGQSFKTDINNFTKHDAELGWAPDSTKFFVTWTESGELWLAEPGFGPVDPQVSAAVAGAADLLRDAGCDVESVRIPLLEQNNYLDPAIVLYGAELGRYVRRAVGDRQAELHFIGRTYAKWPDPPLAEYMDAEIKVDKLKGAFAGYFQKYDVLLCPVIPFTAPPPGLDGYIVNGEKVPSTHMMRATVPFNLTGLPALSVPFTFNSEQLPINVQLVSRWLDESTILQLGSIIEAGNHIDHRRPNL